MRDMDAIERELKSLEKNGRLTPEQVVEAAKVSDSAMHECFEWDDSVAAQHHRLMQARNLLRAVKVTVSTDTISHVVPFYVRDLSGGGKQGYVTIEKIRHEPENARSLVRHELSKALGNLEKAERLAEALDSRGVIRECANTLTRFVEEIEGDRTRTGLETLDAAG